MTDQITLSQDGDQACALLGENLQDGLSGFGDTRAEALVSLALEIAVHDGTPLGHMLAESSP